MSNGFFEFIKKIHKRRQETTDENSQNFINKNPTEEQLKDNRSGKKAIIFLICAIFCCVPIFLIFMYACKTWGVAFFLLLPILLIPGLLHNKVIKYAKLQRRTNGKGTKILVTTWIVMPILIIACGLFLIFGMSAWL